MRQKGFGIVEIVVIACIVLIVGFLGWLLFSSVKQGGESQKSADQEELKVDGHMVQYPKNNQVIIVPSGESYGVTYVPTRDYYAKNNKGEACKNRDEGLLVIGKLSELFEGEGNAYGQIDNNEKADKIEGLIKNGKAADLGEGVYVLAPIKQNEVCEDIYQSSDPALKDALAQSAEVERNWLMSIKLK